MHSCHVGVASQLLLNHSKLLPGEEWNVPEEGWIYCLVENGEGYLLGGAKPISCSKGGLLVSSGVRSLHLRASQIGGATIAWFWFVPSASVGILTLPERKCLENPKAGLSPLPWVLPAEHEASQLFQSAMRKGRRSSLSERSQLLGVVAMASLPLADASVTGSRGRLDAGDRLEEIVNRMTDDELHSLSAEQLANLCRCEKRRLLLLFRERFGESLPGQREAWRRIRACNLLSQPGASIASVARACGYEDSDAFRAWFRRQFGKAPAQWVKDREGQPVTNAPTSSDEMEMASSHERHTHDNRS